MAQQTLRKLTSENRMTECGLDEYMRIAKEFHGSVAPGLLIGGFMVDYALRNLPQGEFFDAIAETRACLPDAVQLLTPCSTGNGWLKVMDFSRFAVCLYEKTTGEGVRVFVESSKLEQWPEIKTWFYNLKPKKEQDSRLLISQIIDAGAELFGLKKITIRPEYLSGHAHGGRIVNCASCGEAFKTNGETHCPACRSGGPYGE